MEAEQNLSIWSAATTLDSLRNEDKGAYQSMIELYRAHIPEIEDYVDKAARGEAPELDAEIPVIKAWSQHLSYLCSYDNFIGRIHEQADKMKSYYSDQSAFEYQNIMKTGQGYYRQMSALGYLRYMAQLKGLPRKTADAQIYELLKIVGLEGAEQRKLGGYSGGMRQRVFIAQAMLGDPKIIILDEPTAGLDPSERIAIRSYIAEMAQGRLVIIATHIVTDIECIARQVLLMQKGKLLRAQPPEELIASIEEKVGERVCTQDEILAYQRAYSAYSLFLRKEGKVLRLINMPVFAGKRIPIEAAPCIVIFITKFNKKVSPESDKRHCLILGHLFMV